MGNWKLPKAFKRLRWKHSTSRINGLFSRNYFYFPLKFKTQNADFNQFYQTRATVGGEAGNFQGYVKLNTSFIPKEWLQFAGLIFTTMVAFLFPQKLIWTFLWIAKTGLITTISLEPPISKNRNLFSVTEIFFFTIKEIEKSKFLRVPVMWPHLPDNTVNPQPRWTVMSLDSEISMPIPVHGGPISTHNSHLLIQTLPPPLEVSICSKQN